MTTLLDRYARLVADGHAGFLLDHTGRPADFRAGYAVPIADAAADLESLTAMASAGHYFACWRGPGGGWTHQPVVIYEGLATAVVAARGRGRSALYDLAAEASIPIPPDTGPSDSHEEVTGDLAAL